MARGVVEGSGTRGKEKAKTRLPTSVRVGLCNEKEGGSHETATVSTFPLPGFLYSFFFFIFPFFF